MVKKLTQADETAINDAIKQAEQHTSTKIRIAVLPSGGHYQDFILLYGLILGSIASCALWLWTDGEIIFPWLLAVQLGVITLVVLVPWLRCVCICLVPRRVRHRRAAEAAHREYLTLHAGINPDEPFVLLFVALAERYVHVVTNPVVHKKIPDNWNAVTGHFISAVRKEGLRAASIQAIEHMSGILTSHFPKG